MKRALLLALLIALPGALAHFETFSQGRPLRAGPYNLYFEPKPAPPFAENPVTFSVIMTTVATGARVENVPVTAVVGGPGDFNARKDLNPDGTGYLIGAITLPHAGNYSVRLLVREPNQQEPYFADSEFEVFPDLPIRVRPIDASADVFVGRTAPLAFEMVDADTLARKDSFDDLSIRIEHWSEDHTQFLGAEEHDAQEVTPGVWRIDHTFKNSGMHHIRFQSQGGGFNYADVPLLHAYAVAPPDEGSNDTPGVGAALLVVAIAAAVALSRRR